MNEHSSGMTDPGHPLRFSGSVRTILALVVLSGILPMLALVLASGWERRNSEIANARTEALELANAMAEQQAQLTHGIRKLLATLALFPVVQERDLPACSDIFRKIVADNPEHGNITLLDLYGEVLASGLPFSNANFSGQKHVRETLDAGRFAAGEYLVGRVSAVPILAFSSPVTDAAGNLTGALTTSLKLDRYADLFHKAGLPPGSILGITDHRGLRLAHYPPQDTNPLGQPIVASIWDQVRKAENQTVTFGKGADGVKRIYAHVRLRLAPGQDPYLNIHVGIPESYALARADAVTRRYLLWLAATALFSFGLAWLVGTQGILRPMNQLAVAAKRLEAGDLEARTGLAGSRGSLGALAKAFDDMAGALARDLKRRTQAEEALRESEEKLRGIFDTVHSGIILVDAAGVVVFANARMAELFACDLDQIVGAPYLALTHESQSPEAKKKMLALIGGDIPSVNLERRYLRKDGASFWGHLAGSRLRHPDGSFWALVGVITDITGRRQAELELVRSRAELEESHAKLALAMGVAHMGHWEFDVASNTFTFNEQFYALYGTTSQREGGLTMSAEEYARRFVHPDDAGKVAEEVAKAAAGDYDDRDAQIEHRIVRRDGVVRHVLVRFTILRDESGRRFKTIGANQDITEHKQAEAALAERKEQLRLFVEHAPAAIAMFDTQMRYLAVSRRWREDFGLGQGEIKGLSHYELFPELPEHIKEVHRRCLAGAVERSEEAPFDRSDGTRQWLRWEARPWRNPAGQVAGILIFSEDVTARKLAEDSLRESEAKYRQLFEAAMDPILVADTATGILVECNAAAAEFIGRPREELIGQHQSALHPGGPPGRPSPEFQRALEDPSVLHEVNMFAAGGRVCPMSVRVSIFEARGRRLIQGIFRDISATKAAEEHLRRAKEAAEAANRTKGEFLANMSHELRTPLNGVLGMLQLLDEVPLSEEQKVLLETALESGRGLLNIINDILNFAQIEAGKTVIVREPISPRAILDSMYRAFRYDARSRGLDWDVSVDPSVPDQILGDGGRLRQVLFNLLGNAFKFTEAGRIAVEATALPYCPEAGSVRLLFSVRDTGIGIPDEKIATVFEPFAQVDGSLTRRYQGTGIGLGIVRALVRLMGGDIAVESETGVGTTMHFTIRCGLAEAEQAEEQAAGPSAGADFVGLRVLLAEDDRVNRYAATRFLERLGCEVAAAETGREALEMLREGEYDLVIMDIQMPEMDGMQATRAIRADQGLGAKSRIPVLAMTAHAMPGDREEFLAAGMNGYIAKPVDMDELSRVLSRILSQS
jgi:PAS domain S-box-containing protein